MMKEEEESGRPSSADIAIVSSVILEGDEEGVVHHPFGEFSATDEHATLGTEQSPERERIVDSFCELVHPVPADPQERSDIVTS